MLGRWKNKPKRDIDTGKWLMVILTDEPPIVYDTTKDDMLDIKIEKHRDGRSDRANRYFHKLVGEIAKVQKVSMIEVKNQMISDYGCVDEEMPDIQLKASVDWRRIEKIHLQPTTEYSVGDDGILYYRYKVMRGSHTYNTKEMSVLIDGVVQEAKELGIETLPPCEIERMKQLWENYGKE